MTPAPGASAVAAARRALPSPSALAVDAGGWGPGVGTGCGKWWTSRANVHTAAGTVVKIPPSASGHSGTTNLSGPIRLLDHFDPSPPTFDIANTSSRQNRSILSAPPTDHVVAAMP